MRMVLSLMISGLLAAPAFASDIRSVEADAYGNAIIRTFGGAKIIAVGQSELADTFVSAETPGSKSSNCQEVGIVLKGRSFMYGLSDGDPVPRATKVICHSEF